MTAGVALRGGAICREWRRNQTQIIEEARDVGAGDELVVAIHNPVAVVVVRIRDRGAGRRIGAGEEFVAGIDAGAIRIVASFADGIAEVEHVVHSQAAGAAGAAFEGDLQPFMHDIGIVPGLLRHV